MASRSLTARRWLRARPALWGGQQRPFDLSLLIVAGLMLVPVWIPSRALTAYDQPLSSACCTCATPDGWFQQPVQSIATVYALIADLRSKHWAEPVPQ